MANQGRVFKQGVFGGAGMKMWIARAESNELCVFREKPFLLKLPELICPIWVYETKLKTGDSWKNIGERIDANAFPEVTFENSPMEVELVIKK